MDNRFFCPDCKSVFEAAGTKIEFLSPVYGPCSKLVANCPGCGKECSEHRVPRISKSAANNNGPSCGMGGCCCGNH